MNNLNSRELSFQNDTVKIQMNMSKDPPIKSVKSDCENELGMLANIDEMISQEESLSSLN